MTRVDLAVTVIYYMPRKKVLNVRFFDYRNNWKFLIFFSFRQSCLIATLNLSQSCWNNWNGEMLIILLTVIMCQVQFVMFIETFRIRQMIKWIHIQLWRTAWGQDARTIFFDKLLSFLHINTVNASGAFQLRREEQKDKNNNNILLTHSIFEIYFNITFRRPLMKCCSVAIKLISAIADSKFSEKWRWVPNVRTECGGT